MKPRRFDFKNVLLLACLAFSLWSVQAVRAAETPQNLPGAVVITADTAKSLKAGYKSVHWLRGGLPEWKAKGYPVE